MKRIVSLIIVLSLNTSVQADVLYNFAKLMKVAMYTGMTAIGIYATKKELPNIQRTIQAVHNVNNQDIELQVTGNSAGPNEHRKPFNSVLAYKKFIIDNIRQDIPFLAGIITTYYGIKGIICTILDKPAHSHHHHHHDNYNDGSDDYKARM